MWVLVFYLASLGPIPRWSRAEWSNAARLGTEPTGRLIRAGEVISGDTLASGTGRCALGGRGQYCAREKHTMKGRIWPYVDWRLEAFSRVRAASIPVSESHDFRCQAQEPTRHDSRAVAL